VFVQTNLRVNECGYCKRQEGIDAERRTNPRRGAKLCRENPMSGIGLKRVGSLREEQTVEGVRNAEDGRCRVRTIRVNRIPAGQVR
jgi:hypothetical protein